MERYLEKIRPIFGKYFDRSRIKDVNNLKQIKTQSRFVFLADNILGEGGISQLVVGFSFDEKPSLMVSIWLSDNNSEINRFKIALINTDIPNNGKDWLGITAPLTDFISYDDDIEHEIEAWFSNAFAQVNEFVTTNSELKWNL